MTEATSFSKIVPLRMIGVSSSLPFCSIIADGKLIYSSGTHIVLENTKNNQQKIVYTHTLPGETQFIVHHTTLYNEHLLVLVVKDIQTLRQNVIIVPLSTAIFSLQEKKEGYKTHHLKYLEDYQQVEGLDFFQEATLFGVISTYEQITNFVLLRASNGDIIFRESYLHAKLLLSSASLGKQNYISLLIQDKRDGTRLCLLAVDQLSRRLFFCLSTQYDEYFLHYSFEASHEESIFLIALTSQGCILIFKINQYEAVLQTRINAKIQLHNDKMLITSSEHLMPNQMQTSGNKIVVSYTDSKIINVFQFSAFNPSNYKTVSLKEAIDQYPNIISTQSIKLSKDSCSLAVLFKVSTQSNSAQARITPFTTKVIASLMPSEQSTEHNIKQTATSKQLQSGEKDHFISLQIDILSNFIEHNNKKTSIGSTLSKCAGQAMVKKVQYCPQNNTMFLLLSSKILKYYDLTPNLGIRGKPQFLSSGLQLWTSSLGDHPISLAAHPFNYSLLILYEDIIKFHNYNCKSLLSAFIVSPIKHCKMAAYSPQGDKIILATSSCLTVVDSYTYRTIHTITLPNIQLHNSLTSQKHTIPSDPKIINNFFFLSNDQLIVLSGSNTLSMILDLQKSVHFGFIDSDTKTNNQIAYDKVNNLSIVPEGDILLILSKATLNSNSKCEIVSKIQIAASSIFQAAELGVLFIGGRDGSIYMIKWPHYSQGDLYIHDSCRTYLFDEPIIFLHATPSMRQVYAVSENGSLAICQLKVGEGDIPSIYKERLLKISDIPFRQNQWWLISRSEQQKKERQLIKLRGEQADLVNNHSTAAGKEETSLQDKLIRYKKSQLEDTYLKELKYYEEQLGIQKTLQQISLIRDQFKLIRRQHERELQELNTANNTQLNSLFQQKNALQKKLASQQERLLLEKQHFKAQLRDELKFMNEDFQIQRHTVVESEQEAHMKQKEKDELMNLRRAEIEQSNQQSTQLMREQFQTQKSKLMELGQAILSKNRNTHIASYRLQDKISEIGIEREKVEIDIVKIIDQKKNLQNARQQLTAALDSSNHVYHKLMKQSRYLQEQLVQERRIAGKLHNDLTELVQDLSVLEERQKQLEVTFQQLNSSFIQQKQKNQENKKSLEQAIAKLQELKHMKKQNLYHSNLAKSQLEQEIRTVNRQLDADEKSTVRQLKENLQNKQDLLKETELLEQFQSKKESFDKLAKNAVKWKSLKQIYYAGFQRSSHKLNEENLKLTYQYNDLYKVSQQYRTQMQDLQERIEIAKRQREQSLSVFASNTKNSFRCTFFGKSKDLNTDNSKGLIRKKGVHISLHQQTGKFITQT